MEKTAVDFLVEQLNEIMGLTSFVFDCDEDYKENILSSIKQAKELFEQQITRAYSTGGYDERDNPTREAHEYFEQNFKVN